MTAPSILTIILLSSAALLARADVSRYYRPSRLSTTYLPPAHQQQPQYDARPTPYPSAGLQPGRQFNLPSGEAAQLAGDQQRAHTRQPSAVYAAPTQYQAGAYSESLAAKTKPARLTSNREDQEDAEDAAASDIEVNIETSSKEAAAATQQATAFAYYPASFLAPLAAAYYQAYQPASFSGAYYTQLQASAPLVAAIPATYFANVAPATSTPMPATVTTSARLQAATKAQRQAQQILPARLQAW